MGMLTWLQSLAGIPADVRGSIPPLAGQLSPRLEQSARVLRLADHYRRELQEQTNLQYRERQERERREQAARQTQWEDEVARSLALRWSYFPGDGDQARDSGPQVRRLEGAEDGGPFYGFVRW